MHLWVLWEGAQGETDRHQAKKQSDGGPEADEKALGWGAQGSEAKWARRNRQSGWPIGSWGSSAVRHLVGKVVF